MLHGGRLTVRTEALHLAKPQHNQLHLRAGDYVVLSITDTGLGLSEEHEGIILLPEDAPVGMALRDYLGDSVLELDLTVDMARCSGPSPAHTR